MFSISEQISAVTKSTLANPLTIFNALSKSAFGGIEKIIALNISTAKQSFESSTATVSSLFSTTQAQELFSLPTITTQPQVEKIAAYGRELVEISSQTGQEFLSMLTNSEALVATVVSEKVATPLISAPIAKVEKKVSVKTNVPSNTQLVLLAEPEVKTAKKETPKSKAKPVVNKSNIVAPPAEIKTSKVMPTLSKTIADKQSIATKTVEATPTVKAVSKPITKAVETKSLSTKPETLSTTETVSTTDAPLEKKSAVKMPFPASPVKKAAKPSFPTVSTRPVYKAKGSAATGAKKPVRQ